MKITQYFYRTVLLKRLTMCGQIIEESTFDISFFFFKLYCFQFSLYVEVALDRECLQLHFLLHCPQAPDKQKRGGNICTCLKFQPCCVVVPGQQAGILESLVASAQLVLTAVSYVREAQISLSAVCLCCCEFWFVYSWVGEIRDVAHGLLHWSFIKLTGYHVQIFLLNYLFCVSNIFCMSCLP